MSSFTQSIKMIGLIVNFFKILSYWVFVAPLLLLKSIVLYPFKTTKEAPKIATQKGKKTKFTNLFEDYHERRNAPTPTATYALSNGIFLSIVSGSVVNFESSTGAIVSAANELLNGSGVDRAILKAGGELIKEDRQKLSWIKQEGNKPDVKCPVGKARLIGPKAYGTLRVPYIIHAVGPDFSTFISWDEKIKANKKLRNAYRNALAATIGTPIDQVGFSLLCNGASRGTNKLVGPSIEELLDIGVQAIHDFASEERQRDHASLKDIVLHAHTILELEVLLAVCDKVLAGRMKICRI